jgi:hypothetical protein
VTNNNFMMLYLFFSRPITNQNIHKQFVCMHVVFNFDNRWAYVTRRHKKKQFSLYVFCCWYCSRLYIFVSLHWIFVIWELIQYLKHINIHYRGLKWAWIVFDFACFYDFSIDCWNCSDCVLYFVFHFSLPLLNAGNIFLG